MLTSDQFLCGHNFAKKSDYIFAQHDIIKNDSRRWDDLRVTRRYDIEGLSNNSIVYCKTDFVPYFTDLLKKTNLRVCLITHDSDYAITQKLLDYCLVPNIIAWYGVNIAVKNSRVFSIPLGIGNSNVPETPKTEDLSNKLEVEDKKLLYINHRIETYPSDRLQPYELFETNSWVTVDTPTPKGTWDVYLKRLREHRLMLCPRGNGIDTYRFWESQYCSVIPVVKDSYNLQFYKSEVPFIVVDDYSDLTKLFLEEKIKQLEDTAFNESVLSCSYWIDKIKKHL